jgi:hypothetical protein
MSNLTDSIKDLNRLEVNKVEYVQYDTVLRILKEQEQIQTLEAQQAQQYNDDNCTPHVGETIKYFFTRKVLLFPPLWLLILLSPDIFEYFGRTIQIPHKLFDFIKVLVVLPFVISANQTAKFYFKDCQNDMEEGVPNAKTIVKYITQSWVLYVALSTSMFLYAVNFEALGMDVVKDIVGTLNVASWLFGLAIFTMWRWFRKEYHFLFSTNSDSSDANSTWNILTPVQKTGKSLAIFFFVIWILTNIFIHLSQQ